MKVELRLRGPQSSKSPRINVEIEKFEGVDGLKLTFVNRGDNRVSTPGTRR